MIRKIAVATAAYLGRHVIAKAATRVVRRVLFRGGKSAGKSLERGPKER